MHAARLGTKKAPSKFRKAHNMDLHADGLLLGYGLAQVPFQFEQFAQRLRPVGHHYSVSAVDDTVHDVLTVCLESQPKC